jgi:hypothetical protein
MTSGYMKEFLLFTCMGAFIMGAAIALASMFG